MRVLAAAVAAAMLSVGAAQAGDVANGERVFNRSCRTCHAIVDPSGKVIVAGQKTGPNQWALIGSKAGHDPEFTRYGASLKAAGEKGLVWTEEEVASYLEDPRAFLRVYLGDPNARSLMAFRLQDAAARADVAAYLATMR
jgi:cytochrome c